MSKLSANQGEARVWCFPALAKGAGIFIFVFGLLDFFVVEPETFMPLSFMLMLAGLRVCGKNLDEAKRNGVAWLPQSFQLWGWFNIAGLIIFRIMSGRMRTDFIHYGMRAPLWLIFGAWLAWQAHQIEKMRRQPAISNCRRTSSMHLFRFGLLFTLLYLMLASLPMFSILPAPGHTATFWPLESEYMRQISAGALSGVLGLPRVLEKLNAVIKPAFDLPLYPFLWFPLQFILVPLFWFLSGKGLPRLMCFYPTASAMVLLALPLQISKQYGIAAFGANGFIQPGYWMLWIPVLLHFVALPGLFSQQSNSKETSFGNETSNEFFPVSHPRKSVLACTAIVVVLTVLMPVIKRSALESLIIAAKANQPLKFSACLEKIKREIPERPLNRALCEAIDQGQPELVEWLLAQQPPPELDFGTRGYSPLWWSMRSPGNIKITEMLLKAGANPNSLLSTSGSYTAVGMVLSGHFAPAKTSEYLQLMLKFGADLNAPVDDEGRFPVEFVLRKNYSHPELVTELISLGANPLKTAVDNIFFRAMICRKPAVMQALFNAGMTALTRDAKGNTFLHQLVIESDFDFEQLREYNVEPYLHEVVNAKNAEGKSPLHIAVEMKKRRSVEALLKLGADQHLTDAAGISPRTFAEKQPIIPLLKIMDTFNNQGQAVKQTPAQSQQPAAPPDPDR